MKAKNLGSEQKVKISSKQAKIAVNKNGTISLGNVIFLLLSYYLQYSNERQYHYIFHNRF